MLNQKYAELSEVYKAHYKSIEGHKDKYTQIIFEKLLAKHAMICLISPVACIESLVAFMCAAQDSGMDTHLLLDALAFLNKDADESYSKYEGRPSAIKPWEL